MGLLSEDYFESWSDWKVELYFSLNQFSKEPTEANHDIVAKYVKENCKQISPHYLTRRDCVIALCSESRKRDAIAIQGPNDVKLNAVNTWKASKHTPNNMRGCWKVRKWASSLYINASPKFVKEHECYVLPKEVYDALCVQFEYVY